MGRRKILAEKRLIILTEGKVLTLAFGRLKLPPQYYQLKMGIFAFTNC